MSSFLLGVVDAAPIGEQVYEVRGMVEKPRPGDAPSNLLLWKVRAGSGGIRPAGEYPARSRRGDTAYGRRGRPAAVAEGVRLPLSRVPRGCGDAVRAAEASIYESLQRPELAEEIRAWLSGLA